MPQRLTIQYVKNFVDSKTNGLCKVLDDFYVNTATPLHIRCKCGNEFKRDFHHIQRGQLYCTDCVNNAMSERNRKPFESVLKEIEEKGCRYIAGDYINQSSVLTLKCRCGNIFKKSAVKFLNGQDRCQECGRKKLADNKKKYTIEDVKREIAKKGYKVVNELDYVDTVHKIRCICSKGHEFDLYFGRYLCGKSGCKKCANALLSGEKSQHYKGGVSDVFDSLRKSVKLWKKEIKDRYNGKCAITGEKPKRLDIHHIDNFLDILEQCEKETGIEVKKHLSDYNDYSEYEILKNSVIDKHKSCLGIAISHSIHRKFHTQYSGQRTTKKQFEDFLIDNYGVKLEEILK